MINSVLRRSIHGNLPDDRPVTAITLVENISNCPKGFYPVSRTYDQDQDADLRESSIFKSSSARYLCLSKTEGLPNFVVSELLVVNEKVVPPIGFSLLNRTTDSEQKAWKKKQLCYRLVNLKNTKFAVTDIIVCSRLKKAPEGFSLAGELNGVTICYKMGNVNEAQSNPNTQAPSVPVRPPRPAPPPPIVNPTPTYPNLQNDDHDYEILLPGYPRTMPPASLPTVNNQNSTNNVNTTSAMEGVPFTINPKFLTSANATKVTLPTIKARTMQQLLKEYSYPFTVEKQT